MLFRWKLNNTQTENLILYFIGGVILIFFSVNSVFLYKQNWENKNCQSPEAIEEVALTYLRDNEKGKTGYLLDCSGYTHRVYKQCNFTLPFSAREQFVICKRLTVVELKKGNLVFFKTNKHDVSHTAIYLDSNRFIHSPGKMKYVRIDSLTNPYWKKRFICGGRPNFKPSITYN